MIQSNLRSTGFIWGSFLQNRYWESWKIWLQNFSKSILLLSEILDYQKAYRNYFLSLFLWIPFSSFGNTICCACLVRTLKESIKHGCTVLQLLFEPVLCIGQQFAKRNVWIHLNKGIFSTIYIIQLYRPGSLLFFPFSRQ